MPLPTNHPHCVLIVLLIFDECPEEVTGEQPAPVRGEVVASIHEPPTRHVQVAESGYIERKRLAESRRMSSFCRFNYTSCPCL